MHKIRIAEEIARHAWMITEQAFDAIRSFADGEELSEDSYAMFHARTNEMRMEQQEQFGRRVPGSYYSSIEGNVGYLMIDGPIIPRATIFSDISGMVSVQTLTSEFMAMEKNPAVKSIAMLHDSPGGVASGISDFASLVRAATKPTYSFSWMSASADYWIASAARELMLSESGMVGSIGTVISFTDYSKSEEKRGVRQIEIVSSQSPDKRPDHNTPEGMAVYQKLVNDLSDVFITAVAKQRNVSIETVLSDFGRGAMRVASEAVSLGMADSVMSLKEFQDMVTSESSDRVFYSTPAASTESRHSNISAEAENTQEEEMNKSPEQIAAEEKAMQDKIAAAKLEATESERKRVQGIEALKANFDAALPTVKAAALKAIDQMKFDADATPENVSMRLLPIVAQSQVGALNDKAEPRRASAKIAEGISLANAPEDGKGGSQAESQARVNKLLAARDEEVKHG